MEPLLSGKKPYLVTSWEIENASACYSTKSHRTPWISPNQSSKIRLHPRYFIEIVLQYKNKQVCLVLTTYDFKTSVISGKTMLKYYYILQYHINTMLCKWNLAFPNKGIREMCINIEHIELKQHTKNCIAVMETDKIQKAVFLWVIGTKSSFVRHWVVRCT